MTRLVKTEWVIELPHDAEVLVKENSKVKAGTLLAKVDKSEVVLVESGSFFAKLSPESFEEWKREMIGKEIVPGDLLLSMGKMMTAKALKSPVTGKIIGIDESLNIIVETGREKEDVRCPMDAEVKTIKSDEIVLEFKASKYKADVVSGKTGWGVVGEKIVTKTNELTSEFEDRMVISEFVDGAFLLKAQALDVAGVLYCGGRELIIESNLPILKVDTETAEEVVGKYGNKSVFIDTDEGKILIVLE